MTQAAENTQESQEALRRRVAHEVRGKARRRVYGRVGFMYHFIVFAMANTAMYQINLHYSPQTLWFVWPLCGWGAALLMHATATFLTQGATDDMIEAEIQRELARRGL
ncbi:MAG TPA: 2TM domain-containing protein [Polyangiales bacterium]|jgi:hypothetical protein|nr:2TM domain-containing protein [Polyangiales bacterium]